MLTRCPSCQTTFRVTTEQLKVRLGKVRCGSCQQVFNALDALVDALPDAPAIHPFDASKGTASSLGTELGGTERSFHSLLSKEDMPETVQAPSTPLVDAASIDALKDYLGTLGAATDPHEPIPPSAKVAKSQRSPWVAASFLVTLVLFLQIARYYRVEFAVLVPEARPSLEVLCEISDCSVDLPSKIELLSIEASDLHPIDPAVPTHLEFTATLRNRAPFAQSWPHLELTLTDTGDSAVARRVIPPTDYLPKGRDLASGFSDQGDSVISFHLTTDGLTASGYRVYLFYP
jgi:predicted Zn finger-like uncharacterized protein